MRGEREVKKYIVVLRETREVATLVEVDEAFDPGPEQAKRQAVEWCRNGELPDHDLAYLDARAEAEYAWLPGEPCIFEERNGGVHGVHGPYRWCTLHLATGKADATQCYEARNVEAQLGALI